MGVKLPGLCRAEIHLTHVESTGGRRNVGPGGFTPGTTSTVWGNVSMYFELI